MANVEKAQFSECTPIQKDSIPILLQGKDLAGLAQTGTGKTAAFLLPLIDRVLRSKEPEEGVESPPERLFPDWKKKNFVLILVPTRELAEQVYEAAEQFTAGTSLKSVAVYGGTSYDKQKAGMAQGVEFVIATPGRLIDLYKEHIVDLRQVRAVIFDEADRMFDMGFKDDMRYILSRIPKERQFLVFSATLNFDVLNTAYQFGAEPVEVNVSKDQPKAENVQDEIFHVGQADKPAYLLSLMRRDQPRQVIVFSNFKRNVERIAHFLNKNGIPAMGISSLLTQAQRNRVIEKFKSDNDANVLVATDLAARGLDILGVDMVINFELPDDPENYVHRIGRTGRAGHKGRAYSLVSDRDVDALSRVEQYLDHKVAVAWMEDQDILTEFTHFPSDLDIERLARANGQEREGGRGGRALGRSSGRSAGPRSGSRSRPSGERRSRSGDEKRSEGREGARRRSRPQKGGRPSAAAAGGGETLAGAEMSRESSSPRRGPRRSESRNPRRSHQGGDSGAHGSRSGRGRRPQRRGPAAASRSAAAAPATPVPAATLGKKVTGFFKKLFGQ